MHGNDINSKLKPNKINRKNVVHTSWYEIDCWEASMEFVFEQQN